MEVQSLAIRTDLIFSRFAGQLIERSGYLVVQTPSNPDYYWGNFLIFNRPPRRGNLSEWRSTFRKEFSYYEKLNHMSFTWDSEVLGDPSEFTDWGFDLDINRVLVASHVRPPPHPNHEVEICEVLTNEQWLAATNNQLATVEVDYGPGYADFMKRKIADYRAMQEQGLGQWYGAYLRGKLVADLGVFFDGGLGRFQSVGTHPDYQRRGICGTLVYQVARRALQQAPQLVMVADEEYHAARIYESVGFEVVENNYQLTWWRSK